MRTRTVQVGHRRRHLADLAAVLRSLTTAVCLTVAYFLLPLDRRLSGYVVLILVGGLLLVVTLIAWQTRAIVRSDRPRLRGAEALATSFSLFVLLFATVYYLMERNQPAAFTEPLTRTDALYFTVTVLATVGFGDIAPRTEDARVLTMFQMLGDILLIGVAVRVLLGAVRLGLAGGTAGGTGEPGGEAAADRPRPTDGPAPS